MRRLLLPTVLMALLLAPAIASAKLPFMGLEVTPLHPGAGEQITLTLTCYEDEAHTRPWSSCLGAADRMAWVHPLDDEGELRRTDWILIEGHATAGGATRGTVTLNEPGSYDVLPLWRTWGPGHAPGMPSVTRIEVGGSAPIVPVAVAAVGLAGTALPVAMRRRRATPVTP